MDREGFECRMARVRQGGLRFCMPEMDVLSSKWQIARVRKEMSSVWMFLPLLCVGLFSSPFHPPEEEATSLPSCLAPYLLFYSVSFRSGTNERIERTERIGRASRLYYRFLLFVLVSIFIESHAFLSWYCSDYFCLFVPLFSPERRVLRKV